MFKGSVFILLMLFFSSPSRAFAFENLAVGYSQEELEAGRYRVELRKMDLAVVKELMDAGIPIEKQGRRLSGAVPSFFMGRLGSFQFKRAWNYWVVKGHVPSALAVAVYDDPIGRKYLRVNGYHGDVAPTVFGSVTSYEIENLEALKRFVELVKEHSSYDCGGIL